VCGRELFRRVASDDAELGLFPALLGFFVSFSFSFSSFSSSSPTSPNEFAWLEARECAGGIL